MAGVVDHWQFWHKKVDNNHFEVEQAWCIVCKIKYLYITRYILKLFKTNKDKELINNLTLSEYV